MNNSDSRPTSRMMTLFLSLIWVEAALYLASCLHTMSGADLTFKTVIVYLSVPVMGIVLATALTNRKSWARKTYIVVTTCVTLTFIERPFDYIGENSIFRIADFLAPAIGAICTLMCLNQKIESAFSVDNNTADSRRSSYLWQGCLYWLFIIAALVYNSWMNGGYDIENESETSMEASDNGNTPDAQTGTTNAQTVTSVDELKPECPVCHIKFNTLDELDDHYEKEHWVPPIGVAYYSEGYVEVTNKDPKQGLDVYLKLGSKNYHEVIPPGGQVVFRQGYWGEGSYGRLSVEDYDYVLSIYISGSRYVTKYEPKEPSAVDDEKRAPIGATCDADNNLTVTNKDPNRGYDIRLELGAQSRRKTVTPGGQVVFSDFKWHDGTMGKLSVPGYDSYLVVYSNGDKYITRFEPKED